MLEPRRDFYVGIAASVTGSVAGAIIAYVVTRIILDQVDGTAGSTLALLGGWFALSVGAAAASFIAAAPFTRTAAPVAFSVFVFSGLLVYPGIVVHRLFDVAPGPLVVFGALLAGMASAILVARIDPT
jgi:hypothetical protein